MQQILDVVFQQVLRMSLTAGVCILAVLFLRLFLSRMPRSYAYGLWLLVAFRLVCPVSVGTECSLFNLCPEWMEKEVSFSWEQAADVSGVPKQRKERSEPEAVSFKEADREVGFVSGGNGELLEQKAVSSGTIPEIWKMLWLFGTAVFLLYFAVSLWRLKGRVRMAVRRGTVRWREEGQSTWRDRPAEIYECEGLATPFVMGIFCPRIYLPAGLTGELRRMVLLHERYHIRRGDHMVKYLAFLLLAVYWFHPLVWAAWVCMCKDMEMSCDEKVLERLGTGGEKAYSRTLLALAAEEWNHPEQVPGFGQQDVKHRIRHALGFRKPAVWAGMAAMMVLAGAWIFLGTDPGEVKVPKTIAERLYEAKNPYIGDVSSEGNLLNIIYEALPDSSVPETRFLFALQTAQEPYEFQFVMEEGQTSIPKKEDMEKVAALMLALTDNLGVVRWTLTAPAGGAWAKMEGSLDPAGAAECFGTEDIKAYGASPQMVQKLLDLLEQVGTDPEVHSMGSAAEKERDT